jgi:hypothetical protein
MTANHQEPQTVQLCDTGCTLIKSICTDDGVLHTLCCRPIVNLPQLSATRFESWPEQPAEPTPCHHLPAGGSLADAAAGPAG